MDDHECNERRYGAFPELKIHKDKDGKPVAYTAGGLTGTSPPIGMTRHFIIW